MAVKIFENVVKDFYENKHITEKDIIEIAKKMQERGFLIKEDIKNKWVSHISQIVNARIGSSGDPIKGYLKRFS